MQSEKDLDSDANDRASDPLQARKKAMDYLARREHGRHELQVKLQEAGFDADTARSAVERLTSDGLQSDLRFVETFLQSRIHQGKGPLRIRVELRQYGIDEPLIDECLDSAPADWAELARRVRLRKFGAGQPRDFREKARQMRFLQYRGFDTGQIQHALAETDVD